jgi:hypothetical protein
MADDPNHFEKTSDAFTSQLAVAEAIVGASPDKQAADLVGVFAGVTVEADEEPEE